MRAPAGRPPPGTAPPKQAPPAGPAPKVAAPATKTTAAAASNSNIPKAPPINWFFSWIKKEPFGDNVPLVPNTTRNNMPEPIAKVEDNNMSDDLDLSFNSADVTAGKANDPGDIFNENAAPKELTMAEQLALAGSKLKSISQVAPVQKELTMAEQLA